MGRGVAGGARFTGRGALATGRGTRWVFRKFAEPGTPGRNTRHYVFTSEDSVVQVHGVGPSSVTWVNPADKPIGRPGENHDERLDEALEESFPASDPPSTRIE